MPDITRFARSTPAKCPRFSQAQGAGGSFLGDFPPHNAIHFAANSVPDSQSLVADPGSLNEYVGFGPTDESSHRFERRPLCCRLSTFHSRRVEPAPQNYPVIAPELAGTLPKKASAPAAWTMVRKA